MKGLHAKIRGWNGKSLKHFESESDMIRYYVRKIPPQQEEQNRWREQNREALRKDLAGDDGPWTRAVMVQAERKGQIKENLMRYNSQERVWGDSPHQYQDCRRVSRFGEEEGLNPVQDLLAYRCLWDLHTEISRKGGRGSRAQSKVGLRWTYVRVTPIEMVAEATADDDEIPQGEDVEGGEKRTQGGLLGTHTKSSGEHTEIETNNNCGWLLWILTLYLLFHTT